MILVLFSFHLDQDFWTIGETDIYSLPMVTVTKKGIVIHSFLDGKEVWYFVRETKEKKRLTQVGQGPSEISSHTFFTTTDGESIWIVVPNQKVIEFNSEGEFVKSTKLPFDIGMTYPVQDGWIALSGQTPTSSGKPTCMIFYNGDFSTKRKIRCWDSEEERGSSPYFNNRQGLFDPTAESSLIRPFLNGRYLTIQIGKTDTFYIYDSQTLELVLEKQVDFPGKKFDRDWGQAQLEEQNKMAIPGLKFREDFPEFFPLIRFVLGTEWAHVRVYPWQINPSKENYITFDLKGNEVTENELAHATYQIVKIEGDLIFFLFLREDESWSVGRLPHKEFLEMNKVTPLVIPH